MFYSPTKWGCFCLLYFINMIVFNIYGLIDMQLYFTVNGTAFKESKNG